MRGLEPKAASILARPEPSMLAEQDYTPIPFEKTCMIPGTRCCEIMHAILAGEDFWSIASRYHDEHDTIRAYAIQLARNGYNVTVPPLEADRPDAPIKHIPRKQITSDTIEFVKKMYRRMRKSDMAKALGLSESCVQEIIYRVRHGYFRWEREEAKKNERSGMPEENRG